MSGSSLLDEDIYIIKSLHESLNSRLCVLGYNTKYIFAGISGDVINVATGVSVEFACTGPDPPTWFVNGRAAVTEGDCYRWRLIRSGEVNYTATLVINGNRTCDTFNVYCRIYSGPQVLYLHNTTLTVQG